MARESKKHPHEYDTYFYIDAAVWCTVACFSLMRAISLNDVTYMVFVAMAESKLGLIAHEACHGVGPEVLTYLYDFALGSRLEWIMKHNKGHHLKTNTMDDPDIQASPILRIHPKQPRYWYHSMQWLYQYPLFCLVPFALRLNGVVYLHAHGSLSELIVHYILSIPAAFLYLVWPVMLYGVWGLRFFVLSNAALGLIYGCLFSVSHVNDLVQFDPTGNMMEKQMASTADWASGSDLVNYLTGGLNHQVIHHMHPHVPSYALPKIARGIVKEGGDIEKRYKRMGGLFGALWSNASYMARIGMRD